MSTRKIHVCGVEVELLENGEVQVGKATPFELSLIAKQLPNALQTLQLMESSKPFETVQVGDRTLWVSRNSKRATEVDVEEEKILIAHVADGYRGSFRFHTPKQAREIGAKLFDLAGDVEDGEEAERRLREFKASGEAAIPLEAAKENMGL